MPTLGWDPATDATLRGYGFDSIPFEAHRARVRAGTEPSSNVVTGRVTAPEPGDVATLPLPGNDARRQLEALGAAAIARGEVGMVVLAGGMATRFGGVVKALAEAVDGHTFLDLKIADASRAAAAHRGRVPLLLMTSFATDELVRKATEGRSTDAVPITCFRQFVSVRLTPGGEVFLDEGGRPSLYAPGHGDLPGALRASGVLDAFRRAGGKVLVMANVDNLAATLDAAVVGAHLAHGVPLTVEVVDKVPGDVGGSPARVDGRLQIVETFRFPASFEQRSIPVFNTNTFLLDAAALDRDFELTWFQVRKKVAGRDAIQFERLAGELSAHLPTAFLRVEREGPDARFLPAKDPEELEARRPALRALLKARGLTR